MQRWEIDQAFALGGVGLWWILRKVGMLCEGSSLPLSTSSLSHSFEYFRYRNLSVHNRLNRYFRPVNALYALTITPPESTGFAMRPSFTPVVETL